MPGTSVNLFVPNAPFLYPLKTSKNFTVFWCFQGLEKGCIGNEWVKRKFSYISKITFCNKPMHVTEVLKGFLECRNPLTLQKRPPEMFYKKDVLKYFAIFTGKHICRDLCSIKLQSWRPTTLLNRDSNTGVFLWKLWNFKKHLFWRASANGCFYSLLKSNPNSHTLPTVLEALPVIGGRLDSLDCVQGT